MTKFLSAVAAVALFALPAFAQDTMKPMDKDMAMTMTCKDMMAMDKDGMMMAADGVNMAMMSDDEMKAHTDMMASMTDEQKTEEMKKSEESMMKMETACKDHSDMTVMEAMKSSM
ncbi:MAG: hypothetical protein ABIR04_02135 [Cypionkella sp.]